MKNKFISAIVSAALLFTLAGCSAQGTGTAVAADEATCPTGSNYAGYSGTYDGASHTITATGEQGRQQRNRG